MPAHVGKAARAATTASRASLREAQAALATKWPVPAALAAVAGLLVAAEGRRRVELVEGVGPDDAGAELVRDLEDPRALLRPDAGGETEGRVVGLRHGL